MKMMRRLLSVNLFLWLCLLIPNLIACQDLESLKTIPHDFSILKRSSNYIVIIGDTQYYMSGDEKKLRDAIGWIEDAKSMGYSIDLVLQTGDITDGNRIYEWDKFKKLFTLLEFQVPVAYCIGNHDYNFDSKGVISEHLSTNFNSNVNYRFKKIEVVEYFEGKPDNVLLKCHLFDEVAYILSLEFGPEDDVVNWANNVLRRYKGNTILLTHAFLYNDKYRYNYSKYKTAQIWSPYGYLPNFIVNDGEDIWNKLVKSNNTIRMVVCGHTYFSGSLFSENSFGNSVLQLLHNPQTKPNGGDGWLQLIEMNKDLKSSRIAMRGFIYNPVYNITDTLSAGNVNFTF